MTEQEISQESSRKRCFVIMPISDVEGYPVGHFGRVYQHIIKPACSKAGFEPLRADDVNQTNYIVIDVVRCIVEFEIAICDLSSRNPNVLYELGLRHSFNKPVILIKDSKTPRIFDIQGLRDVQYDENLRIDSVESTIDALADSIRNTYEAYESGKENQVNSIIQLLGIHPATAPNPQELSNETSLILSSMDNLSRRLTGLERYIRDAQNIASNSVSTENHIYVEGQNDERFAVGDGVHHPQFGFGKVTGLIPPLAVIVQFTNGESKKIIAKHSPLASDPFADE